MYQIVDKTKINIVPSSIDYIPSKLSDKFISHTDQTNIDDSSDFTSDITSTSSYDVTLGVVMYNNIINNMNNQRIRQLNQMIMKTINQIVLISIDLERERKHAKKDEIKYYDITGLIAKYNISVNHIIDTYNEYIKLLNEYLKFELSEAVFTPLTLTNYKFPINDQLLQFINMLTNNVYKLHEDVMSIPSMIPKLQSIDEIDKEIDKDSVIK